MRDQAERTEATEFLSDARWLAAACGLLLIIKVWLASRLDLHSDEVFYWLASTMPAPAYSDLPFVTALLAGLGSALDPGNPLATRALFLLGGCFLPAVVYWLSLPFTGRRDAMQAAFLSICIPLGGFLGLLAVPDVPLLLFGLLSLGFLDRALRSDHVGHWLGTGVFMALGLCTHYRFAFFPAGAMLHLLLYERGIWRSGGFWLAAAIAALGLLPILWANLPGNMGSAAFYFVERHPWRFNALGLLQIPTQALLVTPPLYALLLYSAWLTLHPWDTHPSNDGTPIKKDGTPIAGGDGTPTSNGGDTHLGKDGCPMPRDTHARLLLCVAAPHLLVYALLAPWADANSTTGHWPLPGYFPLLVFAPAALRRSQAWLARVRPQRWVSHRIQWVSHRIQWVSLRIWAVKAVPVIGFGGALLLLAGVGSQSWQTQLQPILGVGVLSEKMAGWSEFAEHTRQLLRQDFAEPPAILTGNYNTAAQLQYAAVAQGAYTLDTDKAVRDGRRRQFEVWGGTGDFLRRRPGEAMLFITEDSSLNVVQKRELTARACGLADTLEQIDQLSLFEGDKRFSFYQGEVATRSGDLPASACPYPPRAWIDQPAPGAIIPETFVVSGWAYNEDLGVERVLLQFDDAVIAELDYGLPRPDVVAAEDYRSDPNQPNLGFQAEIDTTEFSAGHHTLSIRIIDSRGFATDYGHREVTLSEP